MRAGNAAPLETCKWVPRFRDPAHCMALAIRLSTGTLLGFFLEEKFEKGTRRR
jgi:hypothetical protein